MLQQGGMWCTQRDHCRASLHDRTRGSAQMQWQAVSAAIRSTQDDTCATTCRHCALCFADSKAFAPGRSAPHKCANTPRRSEATSATWRVVCLNERWLSGTADQCRPLGVGDAVVRNGTAAERRVVGRHEEVVLERTSPALRLPPRLRTQTHSPPREALVADCHGTAHSLGSGHSAVTGHSALAW